MPPRPVQLVCSHSPAGLHGGDSNQTMEEAVIRGSHQTMVTGLHGGGSNQTMITEEAVMGH